MIRLLGAITGSALALATLLVVIGIPQFKTETAAGERAIVTLPLPTVPVDSTAAATGSPGADADATDVGIADAAARTAVESIEPADRMIADNADIATAPQPALETASVADPPAPAEPLPFEPPQVLDTPQSWYAFWSPFRSELAANGFVAQLQSVTGLDYRVVRVKPGVYEVAFAYQDDEDITANLTQITAATGLELPQ